MSIALASFLLKVLSLLSWLIGLLELVVVISVVLSWLIAFDIVNVRNRTVYQVVSTLDNVSGRLLFPIRRFLPAMAGLDLSPLVFFLVAELAKGLVHSLELQIIAMAGVG
jgi:YggT family protein